MYLEGEITLQVYIKKIVEILFIKTEKKKKEADDSSEEEFFLKKMTAMIVKILKTLTLTVKSEETNDAQNVLTKTYSENHLQQNIVNIEPLNQLLIRTVSCNCINTCKTVRCNFRKAGEKCGYAYHKQFNNKRDYK